MAFIEWFDDYNIGVAEIDSQHRQIVDYINELHEATMKHDQDLLLHAIGALVDYTISHFSFEEELMEKGDYPDIENHKKTHRVFEAHIQDYQNRAEAGEDVSHQIMSEVSKWLLKHIQKTDREYVPYVEEISSNESWFGKSLKRVFG